MRRPGSVKSWITIVAASFVLAMGAAPAAHAAVAFSDDFSAGPSSVWGNESGSWRGGGGVYDATFPSNSPMTYSSVTSLPALTDFAVDVDVNSWDDGGVLLRSRYNGGAIDGILLVTGGFGGGFGGFYWHRMVGGSAGGVLQQSPDLGLHGTSHHLRVEVSGATYRAFVDGILRDTLVDGTYASGAVALYDFSPTSRASDPRGETFDNVVISTPTATTPEPGALLLVAGGLVALGAAAGRRLAPARRG